MRRAIQSSLIVSPESSLIGLTRTLLFVTAISVCFAGQVNAGLPVPSGLDAGDPYHLVFVSSTAHDANFGGITGADAYVQALADAAGIGSSVGVTWQAILSDHDQTNPIDAVNRFSPSAPIYNMNGDRVAANGAALWGTTTANLENPISYDETGAGSTTILIEVWTGTNPSGMFDVADSDWKGATTETVATAGSSIAVNTDWIDGGGYPAEDVTLSLFAASEQLIVPAVPEPSSIVLLVIGGLTFALLRRKNST